MSCKRGIESLKRRFPNVVQGLAGCRCSHPRWWHSRGEARHPSRPGTGWPPEGPRPILLSDWKGKCVLLCSLVTDAGFVSFLQTGDNYEDLHSYFHLEQNEGVLAFCERARVTWVPVPPASPGSGSSTNRPQSLTC